MSIYVQVCRGDVLQCLEKVVGKEVGWGMRWGGEGVGKGVLVGKGWGGEGYGRIHTVSFACVIYTYF